MFSHIAQILKRWTGAQASGEVRAYPLAERLYDEGLAFLKSGRPAAAAQALAAAESHGLQRPYLHHNLALAYSRSGQARAADAAFRAGFAAGDHDPGGDGYYVRNLYCLDGQSLETLKQAGQDWARRYAAVPHKTHSRPVASLSKPLKVGVLSGRFSRHAVGYLSLAAFENLDPARVSLILFDNGSPADDYNARFRAAAQAHNDISKLSDEAAAKLIQEHTIDILIDMGGYSAGGRMAVLARKPAPVQVKWAGGQHGTLGLPQIDFFLTDAVETPPDHDPHFVETPVRLPHSYAVYAPPPDTPDVNALPCGESGPVTFGCFNNLAKISDSTIAAWSRILSHVPGSRVVLKHAALAEDMTRDRVTAEFRAHGIAPEQVDLRPPTVQAEHFATYHEIDITLDPIPWSGCVTTLESLWMGVPVLALPGEAFCHRHSASFLTTLGMTNWIAADVDDYVAKAVALAQDRSRLKDLRASLRSRMSTSPLCDGPGFARDLEDALMFMVKARQTAAPGAPSAHTTPDE